MVEKSDKIPLRHLQTLICISRYALIFLQLPVTDAPVLCRIFPADLFHKPVLPVRAVRQTELPVLISLVYHRIQHFRQKLLRRIIKRHQNTETDLSRKLRLSLPFRFLRRRKTRSTMLRPRLSLDHFISDLPGDPLRRSVIPHPLLCPFYQMVKASCRLRKLPDPASLDPRQLFRQILHLRIRIGKAPCQLRRLFSLPEISIPVIGKLLRLRQFLRYDLCCILLLFAQL